MEWPSEEWKQRPEPAWSPGHRGGNGQAFRQACGTEGPVTQRGAGSVLLRPDRVCPLLHVAEQQMGCHGSAVPCSFGCVAAVKRVSVYQGGVLCP